MSNIFTLIDPDRVRVKFNVDTCAIHFIDTGDMDIGTDGAFVPVSAASWPAIAKAVSGALRKLSKEPRSISR